MRSFIIASLVASFSFAAFANPTQMEIENGAFSDLLKAKNELSYVTEAGIRQTLDGLLDLNFDHYRTSCYKNQEIAAYVCTLTLRNIYPGREDKTIVHFSTNIGWSGLPDGVIGSTVQVEYK